MAGTGADGAAQRRSYAKGVTRRRQIIDSAIGEIAEHGVDGASLRMMSDAIGVSHAALRHYFASRDELLVEVYRAHEQQSAEAVQARLSAVEYMVDSAERNRTVAGLVQLYATLTTDALQRSHPLSTAFVTERFASLRAELADRVRAGQATGTIAGDIDADAAAALVIAASDGLQIQWLLDPDGVDVRRSLALLERLLPDARTDAS